MRNVIRVLVFLAYLVALAAGFLLFAEPPAKTDDRAKVAGIVEKILKADYGDDRPALARLHDDLAPYAAQTGDKVFVSRVRYWQGFALWRRVLNGMNDKAPQEEQEKDLEGCVSDFGEALAADPSFVDAKLGRGSCLFNLSRMDKENAGKREKAMKEFVDLREEARTSENPRVLLLVAASLWFAPADKGGGHATATEMYERALRAARRKPVNADPLDPTWGEPEVLATLAWVNLNTESPDLDAAEANARAALAIVPYWHYCKDILMQNIRDAREGKPKATPPAPTPAASSR